MAVRRLVEASLLVGFGLLGAIFVAEVLLRAFPGLIGQQVLTEFNSNLRPRIARRLGLPLKQDRRCIAPEERSDGGPELCLIAPGAQHRQQVDEEDLVYQATDFTPHDELGFCNPPGKAMRQDADVVTIGDSFTWCTLVSPDATFTALLEQNLGMSTYNLGAPGIGPYEYVEVLRRYGTGLRPKVVIMVIYGGNDLRDAKRYERHVAAEKRDKDRITKGHRDNGLDDLIMRRSYSLNFFSASASLVRKWATGPRIDFGYRVESAGERVRMNVANKDEDEVQYARKLRRGEIRLDLWDRALKDFAELSGQERFQGVVAYLPSAYSAYRDSVVFDKPKVGDTVSFLSKAQRDYLERGLHKLGIPFWDATEYLQAAVHSSGLAYFRPTFT